MRCPKCGFEDRSPNFKFCPQCGFLLPHATTKAKEKDGGREPDKQQSITESNSGFKKGNHVCLLLVCLLKLDFFGRT